MPVYTLQILSEFAGGTLSGNKELQISKLLIDSRKVFSPEESLFIALKGRNHDGHQYIEELYKKGVRAFVTEKAFSSADGFNNGKFSEASFIFVDNTLLALQAIAGNHRKQLDLPVLLPAGSLPPALFSETIQEP